MKGFMAVSDYYPTMNGDTRASTSLNMDPRVSVDTRGVPLITQPTPDYVDGDDPNFKTTVIGSSNFSTYNQHQVDPLRGFYPTNLLPDTNSNLKSRAFREFNNKLMFNGSESDDDGDSDSGGKGKGKSKKRKKDHQDNEYDESRLDVRARASILRDLKMNFLDLASPVIRFVSRYLSATSTENDLDLLYELIVCKPLFIRAEETNDWDGLMSMLYGGKIGLSSVGLSQSPLYSEFGNNVSIYGHHLLDREELANALFFLIDRQNRRERAISTGNTDVIRSETDKLMKVLKSKVGLEAAKLQQDYNTMVTGKVIYLLNPIFLQRVEKTLDMINANCRRPKKKADFSVMNIINSQHVMNMFIQLMMSESSIPEIMGSKQINAPHGGGGMYGTSADRLTPGQKQYQKRTYGQVIINSRPTRTNQVGTSVEYYWALKYWETVEFDGYGGLVSTNEQGLKTNTPFWDISKTNNIYGKSMPFDVDVNNTSPSFGDPSQGLNTILDAFDTSCLMFNKNAGTYATAEYVLDKEQTDSRDSNEFQRRLLFWSKTKPIETIQHALMNNRDSSTITRYEPGLLSFRDKYGKILFVYTNILDNLRALKILTTEDKISPIFQIPVLRLEKKSTNN